MTTLDQLPKENPFRVPEGYFDEVTGKILSATSGKRRKLFRLRHNPLLPAAASLALFLLLGYAVSRLLFTGRNMETDSAAVTEEYLAPYINELDLYTLEENPSLAVPEGENRADKSEIIDYLMLNNIQIEEIYDFL